MALANFSPKFIWHPQFPRLAPLAVVQRKANQCCSIRQNEAV